MEVDLYERPEEKQNITDRSSVNVADLPGARPALGIHQVLLQIAGHVASVTFSVE